MPRSSRSGLGRLKSIGSSGRTVLFVSHDMGAVESLCTQAIRLEKGRVADAGSSSEVIRRYRSAMFNADRPGHADFRDVSGPNRRQRYLRNASLVGEDGQPTSHVPLGGRFRLKIGLDRPESFADMTVAVTIESIYGQTLLVVRTPAEGLPYPSSDDREVTCDISNLPLGPGDYSIKLNVLINGRHMDVVERAIDFGVAEGQVYAEGRGFVGGLCVAPSNWTVANCS